VTSGTGVTRWFCMCISISILVRPFVQM
jgi:hypothetical protein